MAAGAPTSIVRRSHTQADITRLLDEREDQGFPRKVADRASYDRLASILRVERERRALAPAA